MTATEVLRRLLDERGVEWGNIRNDGSESDYLTEWQFEDNQGRAIAIEWAVGSGLSVEIHRYHLTPEQAIAATLGATDARPTQEESSGTCHITDEQPFWHRMADEQPTDEKGKYLLLGKRGGMYLANGFHIWAHSGRRSFYIPNNRSGYVDFDKVKAWAVVPEMEEDA